MAKEILRWHSMQVAVCVLLTLSQVYCENWEQNAERKHLNNFQFDQRRKTCKIGARRSVAAENVTTTEEKLNTLHRVNRKDDLRVS